MNNELTILIVVIDNLCRHFNFNSKYPSQRCYILSGARLTTKKNTTNELNTKSIIPRVCI